MAQANQTANVTIRMDKNLKKQTEQLLNEFGMNMTTAFTIFAKTVVRQGRIPFEISIDVPNAETIKAIEEADKISHDPTVKGYTNVEEMMGDILR